MPELLSVNSLNVLGSIVNTSFAKPSSPSGTHSIIFSLAGSILTCKYSTIVHFSSEQGLHSQLPRIHEEANSLIASRIKEIKKEFSTAAGKSLKAKEVSANDGLELISATANSPRKIAYFRVNKQFEIGE